MNKSSSILFRFSIFLTFCIFLLIIAGGLVTSKEAGLAVPDWPLSYGQAFPPMVGNVFWEHGHRMIAGFVGILALIFMITVHWIETRGWIKVLSRWMIGAVFLQALLGGLTVLLMLPPVVSIFHATLAQTFFCLSVAMSYFLSRRGQVLGNDLSPSVTFSPGLQKLTLITTILIFCQLILGASVRHTQPTYLVVLHILMAAIIFLHVIFILVRTSREAVASPGLLKLAVVFGVFTTIQVFLGMGAFIFKRVLERHSYAPGLGEVFFASAHQSVAALVLGTSLLITLRVRT